MFHTPLVRRALLVVPFFAFSMAAQTTTVYLPDPNPTIPGGTSVNTIPFGSAAYTYLARIPAMSLNPTNTVIEDVAFAPPVSGVWNATNVIIGMGHIPTPLPCPFSFPTTNPAGVGSFIDFTVVFDSTIHGALNWTWTAGQFSPMQLETTSGNRFTWNGINDVGFYITFSGASPTSGFYRNPNGPPERTYATGFQAPVSTGCNALFGLVMALDLGIAGNVLAVSDGGLGVDALTVSLTDITPSATEGWFLVSSDVSRPLGTGPFLGISPDTLTWTFLFSSPLLDGSLFHFPVPSSLSLFPTTPFVLPPGSTASINGATLDMTVLLVGPGLSYAGRSNVVRYAF